MKLLSISGLISAVLFCSCDSGLTEELVFPDPSASENIEIYSERTYTPDNFCEFIGNSLSDYVNSYFSEEANVIFQMTAKNAFDRGRQAVDRQVAREKRTIELVARGMWKVKKIDYAYWTVSFNGSPMRASASLIVPALNDDNTAHMLSALSLCCPQNSLTKESYPTKMGTLLMSRVAFNHAVVVPDYEGRGISSHFQFASMALVSHARQSIDAELAALTILKDKGYELSEDFGTYNIGVSEGCGVSYIAQKMIENDIPSAQRDRINLISTFAANGTPNGGTAFVDDALGNLEYTSEEMYMYTMGTFAEYFRMLPESERGGYEADVLQTHEILKNGKVDMSHPAIQALRNGFARNSIDYNWVPKHRLTFEASEDDAYINVNVQILPIYEMLRNKPDGIPNKNVILHLFTTPVTALASTYLGEDASALTHLMADFLSFCRTMDNLDPSIIDE